eukprot:229223-Rhodomonas_salina.1
MVPVCCEEFDALLLDGALERGKVLVFAQPPCEERAILRDGPARLGQAFQDLVQLVEPLQAILASYKRARLRSLLGHWLLVGISTAQIQE